MSYVISHTFLPETIELAEEYKLIATNNSTYYFYFQSYLKRTFYLTTDLNHYIDETRVNYFSCFSKVKEQDKRYFASLVRVLIYEHYFHDLVQPRTNKNITYFIEKIKVHEVKDKLLQEVDNHLANAEQHFKNVENIMNTLDKYKDQAKVEVTLIHGKPVELYTESELVSLIRDAKAKQQDIADLVDTSNRMKDKHEQLAKDIAVYVSALDSLK